MRWAHYSLCNNGPSFDCMTFMQAALERGAEGVWVTGPNSGWSGYGGTEGEKRRFETILKPIIELYGLGLRLEGNEPKEQVWPEPGMKQSAAHSLGLVLTLKKPFPLMPTRSALDKVWDSLGGRRRPVFAGRNCDYHGNRNTSKVQERWALERDAFILRDNTVSLDERAAYYELASEIWGNNAGHMTLVFYSEHRPYMMTHMIDENYKASRESFLADKGLVRGYQFHWSRPNQRIMWEHDGSTYEDMEKAYREYASR